MTTRLLLAAGLLCALQPAAAAADSVEISEWLVPWEKSEPRAAHVAGDGRVWFVGRRADYVANLAPETGQFSRYDLPAGTGPQDLAIGSDRFVWVAGNGQGYIGRLDPATAKLDRFAMPDRDADDPRTLAIDARGNIWFTVETGNFVGKLSLPDGDVTLLRVPTRKARPYGITVNSRDEPWVAESGRNSLISIDPETMTLAEIELPDEDARPRRVVTTSDDSVWWTDYERGRLGRLDPRSGEFREWPMPGGKDSRPFGMAVDSFDRIWIVETGRSPNRFIGFDTAQQVFFSATDIPSGGGSVGHLCYYAPAGEVWFASDSNYIGRARVHP